MKTTRGDQTDNVVDMNNVKLVITGENGFHNYAVFVKIIFNTTKGDTTMKRQ